MHRVFFHSRDLDGQCSGAIVRYHLEREKSTFQMYPIDYGDEFPMGDVQKDDIVWMVDWCIQPHERLAEIEAAVGRNGYVHLFDHHKTSLDLAGRFWGRIDVSVAGHAGVLSGPGQFAPQLTGGG